MPDGPASAGQAVVPRPNVDEAEFAELLERLRAAGLGGGLNRKAVHLDAQKQLGDGAWEDVLTLVFDVQDAASTVQVDAYVQYNRATLTSPIRQAVRVVEGAAENPLGQVGGATRSDSFVVSEGSGTEPVRVTGIDSPGAPGQRTYKVQTYIEPPVIWMIVPTGVTSVSNLHAYSANTLRLVDQITDFDFSENANSFGGMFSDGTLIWGSSANFGITIWDTATGERVQRPLDFQGTNLSGYLMNAIPAQYRTSAIFVKALVWDGANTCWAVIHPQGGADDGVRYIKMEAWSRTGPADPWERDEPKDLTDSVTTPNGLRPEGAFSDGEYVYVVLADRDPAIRRDREGDPVPGSGTVTGRIRAYRISDGARVTSRDWVLAPNHAYYGATYDGSGIVWILGRRQSAPLVYKLFAYDVASKTRQADRDIEIEVAGSSVIFAGVASSGSNYFAALGTHLRADELTPA